MLNKIKNSYQPMIRQHILDMRMIYIIVFYAFSTESLTFSKWSL